MKKTGLVLAFILALALAVTAAAQGLDWTTAAVTPAQATAAALKANASTPNSDTRFPRLTRSVASSDSVLDWRNSRDRAKKNRPAQKTGTGLHATE